MRIPGLIAMAALVALSTASCGFETIEHRQCPTGGTTVTYDNFGRQFMDDYCQSCHGSTSTNRQGAPGEFIFDTRAQVQHWAARIYARSAAGNDSMPPGPVDPSREDRDRLADWLACGAP